MPAVRLTCLVPSLRHAAKPACKQTAAPPAARGKAAGRGRCVLVKAASAAGVRDGQSQALSEEDAWKKRAQEAKDAGVSQVGGSWSWTLNWNTINDEIVVGSCPRSDEDVERIALESGCNAILCLQSDDCLVAMDISMENIRAKAAELGVVHARCAVRDFSHSDQAGQLPQAVSVLNTLISSGKRVYVHCTAGINRATLTAVGYLTFVQGWQLEHALGHVKHKRPQAVPYVDCWTTARKRLLEGRGEELKGISRHIYETRKHKGDNGDSNNDWFAAEQQLLNEIFSRHSEADLTVIRSMQAIWGSRGAPMVAQPAPAAVGVDESEALRQEVAALREQLTAASERERALQAELADAVPAAVTADVSAVVPAAAPAAAPEAVPAAVPVAAAAPSTNVAFMKAAAREMMHLREENELLRREVEASRVQLNAQQEGTSTMSELQDEPSPLSR